MTNGANKKRSLKSFSRYGLIFQKCSSRDIFRPLCFGLICDRNGFFKNGAGQEVSNCATRAQWVIYQKLTQKNGLKMDLK